MAEKKSVGHAYNVDFLNVVFAASSVFLFLSVIWMVWDDYDREWKNTQRRFAQLEYTVTQEQLNAAARSVDRNKFQQLEAQQKTLQQSVDANRAKVTELQGKLAAVENRLFRATLDYQYAKATYDENRYDFESSRNAGSSSAGRKEQSVSAEAKRVNDLNLEVEKTTAERAALQGQLGEITGQLDTVGKQISEMTAEQSRLRKRLVVVAPSLVKDYFRNAPLLDFMAPTIKIQQTILPNVVDDVNFIRVPKMDRCQTCHLAIDRKGYEKYPQPFTTHPNLAMFMSGSSPHPIDRVGCTVCHEGMGQSVSFRDAAHAPATEKQKEEWEKKYAWEQPHLWDYPMLETKMTEASCAKCHKQQVYLPSAPKLDEAYATYERAGCYACHKTRGFDTNIRKPGPILTKIDSKLTQDWVKTWIRNPRAVKPTTWMPRFWYNSNNSTPEDAVRNEAEIDAIVSYLFANSQKHEFAVRNPPRGDAKAGEQVVKSIGCLGCHVVGEGKRAEIGARRTFGQPLENLGNKTTYEWIYNWVRDPKHYSPTTYMPNLRLTDAQVADIATYLSGLKGEGGDAPKGSPTAKAVDDVLLDYMVGGGLPFEDAKAALGKLNAEQRQVELGRRAINRYGCFSCHEIKGFENAQSIGTDLSEEGSKLVTRLDFAFIGDIPHTSKTAWFRRKLHDPRVFDKGRLLQPLDKLRMPNFDFTDEEVDRLLVAIMSFQREIQPPAAFPVRSARYDYLTNGRTLVHRRNCVGCHIIEGDGGDFVKLVSEPTLGPPMLTPEGARVQPDWLYDFLKAPITIRPWLNVRMPTFGLDDPALNGVIRYFGAVSDTGLPFQTPMAVPAANTDAVGKQLFELLKCQQCHVLGAIPKDQPTANLAPDLRMSAERLQAGWIVDWLKKPSDILPGTRMPAFWPDYPKSFYPHLGGSAEAQILAIRNHLLTLRGGPSPKARTQVANNN
jgi:mono/diheme cytochrome c family protein